MFWQTLPAKRQAPVKVAPVVVLAVWRRLHELKGVQVDSGDIGAHHCCVILCYPSQQRLKPTVEALTYANRASSGYAFVMYLFFYSSPTE